MATEQQPERKFVGRGGLKLEFALEAFGIDPEGLTCADFGCNVGGFTDCMLQRGAAKVYAVDTGYGALDYRLRTDDRVVVMERTNALHAEAPGEPVGLIAIDMGWTTQARCIPAALGWLDHGGSIVTLIKPHYEASGGSADEKARLDRGVLSETDAERVLQRVVADLPSMGVEVLGVERSPIVGGKTKGNARGNVEYVAHLRRRG